MSHRNAVWWWCVGLLVAGAAGGWLVPMALRAWQRGATGEPATAAVSPLAGLVVRRPVLSPSSMTARRRVALPVATANPRATAGSLVQAYNQSTDLRAFAIDARLHPEAGGFFHAARALAECRLRPAEVAGDATAALDDSNEAPAEAMALPSHRRLQAQAAHQARWALRCGAFLPQELSDDAVHSLWQEAARSNDPLVGLMRQWRQAVLADDAGRLRPLWQSIVTAGDPGLLDWAVIQSGGLLGATVQVDPAGDSTWRVDRQQVWAAVSCELGGGCIAPHGPLDALCETLPRCTRERWGDGAWPVAANDNLAGSWREVQRLVRSLRRGEAPEVGAVALASP